jgi:hypothetical protein
MRKQNPQPHMDLAGKNRMQWRLCFEISSSAARKVYDLG